MMNANTGPISDLFSPLKQYFQKDSFSREDVISKPPLRSELLTAEQMDQYARQLASHHTITDALASEKLLRRLADNEEVIFRVTALLHESVREKRAVTPAGEWLLDNFYLIEEEIKTGKRYLPKGYSKGLPKLASGPLEGFPRVYDIAIEIISHSDGHVNIQSLSAFIASYQKVSQLAIGELWAIPIMLRLALLENLRRVAERAALDRADAALADHWASLIIDTAEHNPKDLILVIADMARSRPPMVSAFVAEFARKLQWKGHDLTLPLNWIEQQLSGTSHTINSMVLAENQQQAANQLSVSNSINSLRCLSKMDWREFVETMSVVEQTLRMDEDYPKMDFPTRDHYRHQVEAIAKRSNRSENDVARIALELSKRSRDTTPAYPHCHHVGYYLIGKGRQKTEEAAAIKPNLVERMSDLFSRRRRLFYFSGIVLLTAAVGYSLFELLPPDWTSGVRGVLIALILLLTASQFAIAVVNWLSTILVLPRPIPKMNFGNGLPPEARTLVAIPTLLTGKQQCDKLARDLEVRFLANRDPNILFALLTDYTDAPQEHMPEDEVLLNRIKARIDDLNGKYGAEEHMPFLLFHRPRVYNKRDNTWMGFERKRGKLSDLNRVLRGTGTEKFSLIIGDKRTYHTIRYVITLDTDTLLPRDSAWKLAGAMAHPLNRPVYDERLERIADGYGVIQPRVAVSLHGSTRSSFAVLNESDSGIDPYTQVTSDVYQDVFGEGSFIGKGIYDVDAFEKVLGNRFPKNRILSHDLLEGSYIRSGFASDIQLYEAYPERYEQDVARRHRWIRGDWQIAPWALPWIPLPNSGLGRNPVSWLSRWKIFDNLRRSLFTAALTLQFILGWIIFEPGWAWTLITLGLIVLPSTSNTIWNALRKPKEIRFKHHLNNTVGATHKTILQTLFMLACLPYEAYVSLTAIMITLWRVHISKRNLLEWSASGIRSTNHSLPATIAKMWFAPALAVGLSVILYLEYASSFVWAAPFLLVWFSSPFIVWLISRPKDVHKTYLKEEDRKFLRIVGRKTWAFFEQHVTEGDNWLPPDNLQQYPVPVIAHRTSPTNIGMSLLSALAAHDFGWISTQRLLDRISKTFETLGKLERYKGHFYNWYDTQSLQVLRPNYISSVDSGNLAGHLHTLRQGLLELPHQKVITGKMFTGLKDTLTLLTEVISKEERAGLRQFEEDFRGNLPDDSSTVAAARDFLNNTESGFREAVDLDRFPPGTEPGFWAEAFLRQIDDMRTDLQRSTPWISLDQPSEKLAELIPDLNEVPVLSATINSDSKWKTVIRSVRQSTPLTTEESQWLADLEAIREQSLENGRTTLSLIRSLADQCLDFADIDYEFLYDKAQRLISIGYSVDERHRDTSFYDLLASEARLSSFVGIAQGKLPEETWFALGRRLTSVTDSQVLLSWSGSMFEYLMPMLVMPTYEHTLLEETCQAAVDRQIEYGNQQNVPWGISECCYNLVDGALNYQYRAFGVPGLGFKRGLGHDLVIAPYASVMALMVRPNAALSNMRKLRELGFEGRYGFYESIDYTPERLSRGQKRALIQTFMAHHQGMSLLSLAYVLLDKPMQRRFENDPGFQASLLLLQEQVPKITSHYESIGDTEEVIPSAQASEIRVIKNLDGAVPEVQLLSNGRYHVMVTQSGGGYSKCRETALTRWREDSTCDNWGSFCYVRDLQSGRYWSTSYQPTAQLPKSYEAIFSQGRAEFRRRDHDIETYTEIIVSPEDDIEVRRIHLVNHSKSARNIELTSYSEVVLALPVSDDSHPAFSNLFVQTEINPLQHVILCTRRPRSHDERPPWMFHLMKADAQSSSELTYETDRSKFIGRGRSPRNPAVMDNDGGLSGSQGSVLDPIVAIQCRIQIEAGETACVDLITGISSTRDGVQVLIDKYQDLHLRDRAFELSWTHSQVVLRQIGATESDAQLFGKLASSVIHMNPAMRGNPGILIKNTRGQSALWSYSISGDLPIVLLQVANSSNISIIRQLVLAQAYWHLKGLAVDLIILNEDPTGYRQLLQDQILGLIAAGIGINAAEKQGRIFVRSLDQVSAEDLVLFQTVARVIISDSKGSLADQVNKRSTVKNTIPVLIPTRSASDSSNERLAPVTDLEFFNGTGGFNRDGNEYVINVSERRQTPLPWANVIANKNFGTIVTESGPGYTWSENAHEFRLTPWHNDPISSPSGEAFYLRDEETGRFWSPTLLPCGSGNYTVRHGFGYTTFIHEEEGILSELTVFVDIDEPIRFSVLRLTNRSGRKRKLTATAYAEWVLGGLRQRSIMHVVCEQDQLTGALIARNPYNTELYNRAAFLDTDDRQFHFTTSRAEFVGRNGSLAQPDAMTRTRLSGTSGAGLDPCAAIQVPAELESGHERVIVFRIGCGRDMREAEDVIKKFKGRQVAQQALERVRNFWSQTLNVVRVQTPDKTINLLANGWLLYQVLSSRLWGRSGFYQSGGAYGFRDQLQDVIALLHARPQLAREQILMAASRQFREGDVQHWWHPPMGRGVRTLCSDDMLWLPYVVSRYVVATGDYRIFDEQIPFLQGRQLNENEESYFDLPIVSDQRATLYDHCKRAVQRVLRMGPHGLPLMGSGDWNDGMNMVGIHGTGESVWLAFFLYDVLIKFVDIARKHEDDGFADIYLQKAAELKESINANAWDGNWYIRAFFDNGTPLGSEKSDECQIDSISQSWAVISGAGEPERIRTALASIDNRLVNRQKNIIQLLDPPFDKSEMDPGYIKGYVPGVRENGGQYTHAAIWMVMAFARLGDSARAMELFRIINPINHGITPDLIALYKAEPYVVAADVYGVEPHTGRSGWTWYTGSAGWMYQLIIESLLGIHRSGNSLHFAPCVPPEWQKFTVEYTFEQTKYIIEVRPHQEGAETNIVIDGNTLNDLTLPLANDGITHRVFVDLPASAPTNANLSRALQPNQ